MIRPALYLVGRSVRNWSRIQLGKFRRPSQLAALLLGGAYVWFFLRTGSGAPQLYHATGALESIGALLLAFAVARWWILGADGSALAFTQAEIQFLFPAPLSRRQLILFKLLRSQLLILLSVLVWTVLLGRGGSGFTAVLHAVGLWVLFSTLFLHRLGVALTRSATAERISDPRLRAVLLFGAIVAASAAIGVAAKAMVTAWPGSEGFSGLLELISQSKNATGFRFLLAPFLALLRPVHTTSGVAWLAAMVPAVLILLLHLAWVIRADRAFEEAAITASARRARLVEDWRRGKRWSRTDLTTARIRLPLRPGGHPLGAVVWKNLTRALRDERPTLLVSAVALLVAATVIGFMADGAEGAYTMLFSLSASWGALLIVFGAQWVRNDLRGDFAHLSILRAWPIEGQTIMAGGVLSSALILSVYQVGLLLVAAVGALGATRLQLETEAVVAAAVSAGITLPLVNVLAIGIQNAGALLYPSWVRRDLRPGGIEALGLNLLAGTASLLLLLVLCLVPFTLGFICGSALWGALGVGAWLVGAVVTGVALLVESFLFLEWLGNRFDAFDPSSVI